jgi:hypothetical protein
VQASVAIDRLMSVPSTRCYIVAGADLSTAKGGTSVPLTLRILPEIFRHDDGASDADDTPNICAGLRGDGHFTLPTPDFRPSSAF